MAEVDDRTFAAPTTALLNEVPKTPPASLSNTISGSFSGPDPFTSYALPPALQTCCCRLFALRLLVSRYLKPQSRK